jgi:plastocyanin
VRRNALIASTAAALAAASLGLAACGSSSSSSNNASTSTATESTAPATTAPAKTTPAKPAKTTPAKTTPAKPTPAPAAAAPIKVQASPTALAFQEKTLTAKTGENTFDFTNPSAIPHDFAIKDSSGKKLGSTKVITKSGDTLKINLKPGTYEFYCTVPGHEQAGMKGTLTVK